MRVCVCGGGVGGWMGVITAAMLAEATAAGKVVVPGGGGGGSIAAPFTSSTCRSALARPYSHHPTAVAALRAPTSHQDS